jgi:hypothetical protein
MKKIKLNQGGISHILLPLVVVLLIAIGGTYMLVSSQARSTAFIDISSPQCGSMRSIGHYSFGIIGLNGTKLNFASNPCAGEQIKRFSQHDFYVGANYPSKSCSSKLTPRQCGIKAAQYDLKLASRYRGAGAYWIDVESGPGIPWSTNSNNVSFLRGMYDTLKAHSSLVGFYSNDYYWSQITGNTKIFRNAPLWYAAGQKSQLGSRSVSSFCRESFGGGKVLYVQYVSNNLDHNITC